MDPAFSSMPPPGPDDGVKPMSVAAAFMWAAGAQLAYLWVIFLMGSLRGEPSYDPIGGVMAQVVGYLFTLYLMLRVYAPELDIRDFVAMRRTHVAFYPLALVLGLASTLPAYWLLGQIERVYPSADESNALVDLFYRLTMPERVLVAVMIIVVGPIIEELVFRGALFRPLRQALSAPKVIAITGALFAMVHINPVTFEAQHLPSLLSMGLVLGYVRWAGGSIVPPMLLHMGFNAVPFVDLFRYPTKPPDDAAETVGMDLMPYAFALAIAILVVMHLLARLSRAASGARRDDG